MGSKSLSAARAKDQDRAHIFRQTEGAAFWGLCTSRSGHERLLPPLMRGPRCRSPQGLTGWLKLEGRGIYGARKELGPISVEYGRCEPHDER